MPTSARSRLGHACRTARAVAAGVVTDVTRDVCAVKDSPAGSVRFAVTVAAVAAAAVTAPLLFTGLGVLHLLAATLTPSAQTDIADADAPPDPAVLAPSDSAGG